MATPRVARHTRSTAPTRCAVVASMAEACLSFGTMIKHSGGTDAPALLPDRLTTPFSNGIFGVASTHPPATFGQFKAMSHSGSRRYRLGPAVLNICPSSAELGQIHILPPADEDFPTECIIFERAWSTGRALPARRAILFECFAAAAIPKSIAVSEIISSRNQLARTLRFD